MNLKKITKVLCYFIILSLFIVSIPGADVPNIPTEIKVSTEKNKLDRVKYDDYYINANKMKAEGRDEIVYCLEINRGYPSNQIFKLSGNASEEIDNIIAAGYPSKSPAELNLSNENEAYFATQIAIWSSIEGYDVNKMEAENENILNAIKNIYNEGSKGNATKTTENKEYSATNKSVQDVVLIFGLEGEKQEILETPSASQGLTEEEVESQQDEYPPQEG